MSRARELEPYSRSTDPHVPRGSPVTHASFSHPPAFGRFCLLSSSSPTTSIISIAVLASPVGGDNAICTLVALSSVSLAMQGTVSSLGLACTTQPIMEWAKGSDHSVNCRTAKQTSSPGTGGGHALTYGSLSSRPQGYDKTPLGTALNVAACGTTELYPCIAWLSAL